MFHSRKGLVAAVRLRTNLLPTLALASVGAHVRGFCKHVVLLKQAPPPSMKMMSLSEAMLKLTAKPVADRSRQMAPVVGTALHTMSGTTMGSPGGTTTPPSVVPPPVPSVPLSGAPPSAPPAPPVPAVPAAPAVPPVAPPSALPAEPPAPLVAPDPAAPP